MKVVICHKNNKEAEYYKSLNEESGYPVHEDEYGYYYCEILTYNRYWFRRNS